MTKRMTIHCVVAFVLTASACAWAFFSGGAPPPEIRFVKFQGEATERQAVYRIRNNSNASFSFSGYGLSFPYTTQRIQTGDGWEEVPSGWCGVGAGTYTIEPHAEVEFATYVRDENRSSMQVGVYFEEGAAADVEKRHVKANSQFSRLVRDLFGFDQEEAQIVWSDTAKGR